MAVRKLSLPLFTRKDRSLAAPLLYTSLRFRPQTQKTQNAGTEPFWMLPTTAMYEVCRRLEWLPERPAQAF